MILKRLSIQWRLALLVIGAYGLYKGARATWTHFESTRDAESVRQLVASEELILELTPRLKTLSQGILNLRLPDHGSRTVFASSVRFTDIAANHAPVEELSTVSAVVVRWPSTGVEESRSPDGLDLWRPLLDEISYFENAKFYFVEGRFTNSGLTEFDSLIGFKGLARRSSKGWSSIKATQRVRWQRPPPAGDVKEGVVDETPWRIATWTTKKLETINAEELLFVEALDQALPETDDLRRARRSLHEEVTMRYYEAGARKPPFKYFAPISANLKPGLSVVDVDGDGLDDLYVTVRLGKNQLLLNRGDGTFEEAAARFGLDIPGHSTSAIFADFDNDGDPDLMLARSLARSMYLENQDGRFVHRPDAAASLPYLAVSTSASDYNGDGLLDVYISTYRPAVLEDIVSRPSLHDGGLGPMGGVARTAREWPDQFLDADQAREYYRQHAESNKDRGLFANG